MNLIRRELAHVSVRPAMAANGPSGSVSCLYLVGVVVYASPVVSVDKEGALAVVESGDDLRFKVVGTI
jgi:hypothetical protein